MSNVIPFPDKENVGWQTIQDQISALLANQGYSEAFIEEVLRRFKLAYDEIVLDHALDFDGVPEEYMPTIRAQTDALQEKVSRIIHSLLGTLVATLVSAMEAEGLK